ncbi:MAG: hypothetical protein ABIP51_02905 [Bacteroidia bacterium]
MKYSRSLIAFSFIAAITVVACKTKKETKTTTAVTEIKPVIIATPSVAATPITGIVTYETLKPLLDKSCNTSGCHDFSHPRINFTNYANFKKFGAKGEISHAVLEKKFMPPDEKLTEAELDLFKRWIADGMTEK